MKLPGFTAEASLYKVSNNYPKESHVNMDMKSHVTMQQISQLDFNGTRQEPQLCASVEWVCTPPYYEECANKQRCHYDPFYEEWICEPCIPRFVEGECHLECRWPGYQRLVNFQLFPRLIN